MTNFSQSDNITTVRSSEIGRQPHLKYFAPTQSMRNSDNYATSACIHNWYAIGITSFVAFLKHVLVMKNQFSVICIRFPLHRRSWEERLAWWKYKMPLNIAENIFVVRYSYFATDFMLMLLFVCQCILRCIKTKN